MTTSLKALIATIAVTVAALLASAMPAGAEQAPRLAQPPIPMGVQMFGNDTEGDCVLAAVGDLTALWNPGEDQAATAATVQQWWQAMNAPAAGLNPEYVLYYWETHPIAGFTISGFTPEAPTQANIEQAVQQDGAAYMTIDFGSWYTSPTPGTWTTANDVGVNPSLSHEILISNYNAAGVEVITWGRTYTATWGWVAEHATDLDLIAR